LKGFRRNCYLYSVLILNGFSAQPSGPGPKLLIRMIDDIK
jgi:hypothetical protein